MLAFCNPCWERFVSERYKRGKNIVKLHTELVYEKKMWCICAQVAKKFWENTTVKFEKRKLKWNLLIFFTQANPKRNNHKNEISEKYKNAAGAFIDF